MNSLQELSPSLGHWEVSGESIYKNTRPLLIPSSCFLPVHLRVFEKQPEPSPDHGAPLHHPQTPGGAGPNVQPGVQESLPVQAASTAAEEGKRSSDGCCLSATELPAFFLFSTSLFIPASKTVNFQHSLHCCVDNLHPKPVLFYTGPIWVKPTDEWRDIYLSYPFYALSFYESS